VQDVQTVDTKRVQVVEALNVKVLFKVSPTGLDKQGIILPICPSTSRGACNVLAGHTQPLSNVCSLISACQSAVAMSPGWWWLETWVLCPYHEMISSYLVLVINSAFVLGCCINSRKGIHTIIASTSLPQNSLPQVGYTVLCDCSHTCKSY
jgi:hypothetical protein